MPELQAMTGTAPVDVDLEKLRDEKCIPVAKQVLEDLTTDLIAEDANVAVDFNPITIKVMQRMLDADTNIATENSYVFQLVLGAFAGLNKTVQKCTVANIDDVRYGRIAKEVLNILYRANIDLKPMADAELEVAYAPLLPDLNELFSREKLSMMEVKYVMDTIFTSFNTVTALVNTSVEGSAKKAEAKLFQIPDMLDLSMKKLDDVLKS